MVGTCARGSKTGTSPCPSPACGASGVSGSRGGWTAAGGHAHATLAQRVGAAVPTSTSKYCT